MAISYMGDCVLTGILKVEIILIIGVNYLPCQSNPLVKILEEMTIILKSNMILGDFTIFIGERMVHRSWIPAMSPVKMI